MDLKAKLALLRKEVAKIDEKHARKAKNEQPRAELPCFTEEETSYGKAFYRETVFPLQHRHGEIFLRELLETPREVFALMGQDEDLCEMDPNKTLFLDTETTGLAGGTGTVAFLVGVGFYRDDEFVIRQYFMPDYPDEAAMLESLNLLAGEFKGLITFNGKCYDIPLIESRMAMNRLRFTMRNPLHLDLLPGSRRLWKKTHGSCALTSLETSVLKFFREDDVPGFLIPDLYFQYLRDRNFHPLEKVFEHNVFDIVSMAALTARVWSHLEMAEGGMVCGSDYYSLARIYERKGEEEEAIKYYGKALEQNPSASIRNEVRKRLALIFKRKKEFDGAIHLWEEMAGESNFEIYAHMELAKHCEHKTGQIEKAIEYVDWAMEIVSAKRGIGAMETYYREKEQLTHRKIRLLKKLSKKQEQDTNTGQ